MEPGALASTEVFAGKDFVARYLGSRTPSSMSSVLWRRQALLDALKTCRSDLKNPRKWKTQSLPGFSGTDDREDAISVAG
jgi:hypothetical protein